ncbi:ubiquinone biosynthesis protein COQ9 [Albidovulum inexpectatum]|uniref:Ubiquinone biosynthesis protein COQ9 n=1 Tax=Albidovulum inexpectatum TaxID=196587 RepID=A0A2S5JLN8_9RHOB|nr:COQ9 family protein [Albidovulum inexpectatum]PPB82404.1 ubiquinone biosynthesis protein COQ9 [Albidovulum inexpectatum]
MTTDPSFETGTDSADLRARLLQAALPHVVFDGWSQATFEAALNDSGINPDLASLACPRGAVDLAVEYHRQADARMRDALAQEDLSGMRFRDRVAHAIWLRLQLCDREIVRRGAALFALPQNAAIGARLVWETADSIWRALGDRSDDINWYTKRATLAAVWSSVVLYWLGDDSDGQQATRDFIDRRIDDVMRIETLKARLREAPLVGRMLSAPLQILSRIHAPWGTPEDLPGRLKGASK